MNGAKKATPYKELMRQLLDRNVPKTEREHAAARTIEELLEALEQLEALETLERLAGLPSMKDDPIRVKARKAIKKARGEE